MHFIVTGFEFVNNAEKGIKKALKKFGCTSAILSGIEMTKQKCITRKKYEEEYKTDEESETRMDLSVGEDLETFVERIKNEQINIDTIPEIGERKFTFLLCLLDKKETKKLEQEDEDFMESFSKHNRYGDGEGADVPEVEFKASESNMKFARSICRRWTYFIDA